MGKECQFVSCGVQHTMAITRNKKTSKIASKRAVEEANLDRLFKKEETRRMLALKSSAVETVERRKRQSALDLEFIQSRVSRSAGDYVTKSLEKQTKRNKAQKQAERDMERKMSPTRFRTPQEAASRPYTARSARTESTATTLTNVPLGYKCHRYRSELRQMLQDIELYKGQDSSWGKPAHFMPVAPSEPQPPSSSNGSSTYRRPNQRTARERPSTARTYTGRGHQNERPATATRRTTTLRPSTAREPGVNGASVRNGRSVRPVTASERLKDDDALTEVTDKVRARSPVGVSRGPSALGGSVTSRSHGQRAASGFRPPSSWDMYWKPDH